MAIVRNIHTNDLYRYLGDNKFKSIKTGVEKTVSNEMAQKSFKINLEATCLLNEYPVIEEFIRRLNLKIEK